MKRAWLILPFVFVLLTSSLLAQQRTVDVSGTMERAVLSELDKTNTPGAAVAVILGDRVVFAKGFGVSSIETGNSVTPEMLFQIGSMTKMFTATALVTLAEEGKIKFDEPIGTYVTGLNPKLAQVTVHQLLSHTAGLKDEPDEYGLHDESALSAYVRSWKDDYGLLPPGKVFSYSNSGLALAGFVMEAVGGKPYADQMNERLFVPLGMSRTTFRPTMAMTYPLAVGHRARGQEKPAVVRPMADDARLWPAGEMFSNVNDLARFAIAFMNGGSLEGKPVLPPAVITKLSTPYADIPATGEKYGYGFLIGTYRGVRWVGHEGTMPGFSGLLRIVPEHRCAVIALANRETRLDAIAHAAFDLVLPVSAPAEAKLPKALPMTEAEMAGYVGTYSNPNRWTIQIVKADGKLVMKQFGLDLPITRIGPARFSVTFPGASQAQEFVLGLGTDGKPEYLQMFMWAFKRNSS